MLTSIPVSAARGTGRGAETVTTGCGGGVGFIAPAIAGFGFGVGEGIFTTARCVTSPARCSAVMSAGPPAAMICCAWTMFVCVTTDGAAGVGVGVGEGSAFTTMLF